MSQLRKNVVASNYFLGSAKALVAAIKLARNFTKSYRGGSYGFHDILDPHQLDIIIDGIPIGCVEIHHDHTLAYVFEAPVFGYEAEKLEFALQDNGYAPA